MYGIIDTNQVLKLRPQRLFTGINQVNKRITLSPYVLGEILLRENPHPTLERLRQFDIRFGMEPTDAVRNACRLDQDQLSRFKPFIRLGDLSAYDNFYRALTAPDQRHYEWARRMHEGNREFCGDMFGRAVEVRAQLRRAREISTEKFCDLDEALRRLPSFSDLAVSAITNGGSRRPTIEDQTKLYAAAMENPHLRRLFRTILFYLVSWSRQWRDQSLNFDPSPERDDWTDLTLTLFSGDGDVILTEDRKLQIAVRNVEPSGKVSVAPGSHF